MPTAALPATFAEARSGLRPVLRGRAIIEYMRLTQTAQGTGKPWQDGSVPFSADIRWS